MRYVDLPSPDEDQDTFMTALRDCFQFALKERATVYFHEAHLLTLCAAIHPKYAGFEWLEETPWELKTDDVWVEVGKVVNLVSQKRRLDMAVDTSAETMGGDDPFSDGDEPEGGCAGSPPAGDMANLLALERDLRRSRSALGPKYADWRKTMFSSSDDAMAFWTHAAGKGIHGDTLLTVRFLLSLPATSAPVERLFSSAGLAMTAKQTNILPENFESKVIVKEFFKQHNSIQRYEYLKKMGFAENN